MKNELNVLYILGAGFSAPAGLPTIGTFYRTSRRLFFTEGKNYEHFKPVFDYIERASGAMNYLDAELFNIEELLSIIEMDNVANSRRETEIDINRFVIDTVRACTPKIMWESPNVMTEHLHLFKCQSVENNVIGLYAAFILSLINADVYVLRKSDEAKSFECLFPNTKEDSTYEARYSVLTFNYDTLIEQIVQSINLQRLDDEYGIRICSKYSMSDDIGIAAKWELPFCKPHGSLKNDLTFDEDIIIAPTSMKAVKETLVEQWKTAHERLSKADVLVFVGYSFAHGDTYLQYLLKSALKHNIDLQSIVVVNSGDAESLVQRYRSMFPRVQSRVLLNYPIEDFFKRTCMPDKPDSQIASASVRLDYSQHWNKVQNWIHIRGRKF